MPFATDNDLLALIPTIFDHGEHSFQDDLDRAEADVVKKIKVEWYNKRYYSGSYDESLLTASQWKNATIYRALGFYIMPKLSQWRPESDSFREQMNFYQERFAEEMADEFGVGIEYDYNDDGTVDTGEEFQVSQTRMWR